MFSGANDKQKEFAKELLSKVNSHEARLVAIFDTTKGAKDSYQDIIMSGAKFFSSMNSLYEEMNIDLTIVASHSGLHSMHACMAMENDSHVIIMKPLAGCMEDASEIMHIAKITGKKVLVGYETLHDDTVWKVKETILSSYLGGLIDMKMICLTPKPKSYFSDGLSGKICDASGRLVMNSVASEDAANHIMSLVLFAGDALNTTGHVEDIEASLYKVNDIETFDSCAIKAQLEGGIGMLAIASQATDNHLLKYLLWFERGYIEYADSKWTIYDNLTEEVQEIGLMTLDELKPVWDMIDYINNRNIDAMCSLEGVAEHASIIDKLSDRAVENVDEYDLSLEEKLLYAYDNYCLPNEI